MGPSLGGLLTAPILATLLATELRWPEKRDYYRRLTETGIHVLFTRVRRPILAMFEEARFYDDVSREFIHRNPADVYRHAWELISAGRDEQPEAPQLEGPDEPKYQ
mgnify:CR=1 FL=1